jgi:hypothetical protein
MAELWPTPLQSNTDLIDETIWNQIVDNLNALRVDTTDTVTNGGEGNVTLAQRLGTGVGIGTNVVTGNAAAQLIDLRARAAVLEARTLDTSGVVGIGNQRLSDRLGAGVTTSATADARFGAGVGTGANVTTGSAASQLADLRSRATVVETLVNGGTNGNVALGALVNSGSVGNTALGTRTTAQELITNTQGRWYFTQGSTYNYSAIGGDVPFNTVDNTAASGVSLNTTTGVITVTNAGRYDIASLVYGNLSAVGNITLAIVKGATPHYVGGGTVQLSAASDFFVQASATDVTFAAGETFKINLTRSGAGALTSTTAMMAPRAINVGIQRVG